MGINSEVAKHKPPIPCIILTHSLGHSITHVLAVTYVSTFITLVAPVCAYGYKFDTEKTNVVFRINPVHVNEKYNWLTLLFAVLVLVDSKVCITRRIREKSRCNSQIHPKLAQTCDFVLRKRHKSIASQNANSS